MHGPAPVPPIGPINTERGVRKTSAWSLPAVFGTMSRTPSSRTRGRRSTGRPDRDQRRSSPRLRNARPLSAVPMSYTCPPVSLHVVRTAVPGGPRYGGGEQSVTRLRPRGLPQGRPGTTAASPRRSCWPCWCSWCSSSSSWCCWWRWYRRASPPGTRRSPGPRRSPTRAAPTRFADHAGADLCRSSFTRHGDFCASEGRTAGATAAAAARAGAAGGGGAGEHLLRRVSEVQDLEGLRLELLQLGPQTMQGLTHVTLLSVVGEGVRIRTCSWWSMCRRCTCWCCWWRWCRRASPPESQRSPGPRRSPTRAAPTRSAGRRCCCSWRYQAPSTSAAGAAGAGATAAGAAGGAARGRGGTAEHLLPGLDQVENLEGLRLQELQLPLEAGQRVRTGSSAHQRRLSISRYRPGTWPAPRGQRPGTHRRCFLLRLAVSWQRACPAPDARPHCSPRVMK